MAGPGKARQGKARFFYTERKKMMQSEKKWKIITRGISDIMFDRYAGDNKTDLLPEQKMYFAEDGKTLVLPSTNIMSLLSAQNTPSAPKRFLDTRKYKAVAQAILSYVSIQPSQIPILRKGKPIKFNGFENDLDKQAQVYIHRTVARLDKGIPNPKARPTVSVPWGLEFELIYFPNDEFNETLLFDLLSRGLLAIGLGTFRGVYGKCVIDSKEKL